MYCNYGHDESECKPATHQYESVGIGMRKLCVECVQDVEQSGGILILFLDPIDSK